MLTGTELWSAWVLCAVLTQSLAEASPIRLVYLNCSGLPELRQPLPYMSYMKTPTGLPLKAPGGGLCVYWLVFVIKFVIAEFVRVHACFDFFEGQDELSFEDE